MYIKLLFVCTMFRRTLLRYNSYAYIVCTACESNLVELPINLFIIIM